MDIIEIRRARLRDWFADRTLPAREKSYISQLIHGKASFGEKAARRLEADYGMPRLYLDGEDRPETDAQLRRVWVIERNRATLRTTDRYIDYQTDDPQAFVVRVRGTAMSPRYMPGEYVMIEPSIPLDAEDHVLVRLANGETHIRRLLSQRGGLIRLGRYDSTDVATYHAEEVEWMYHVAHAIPAHRIRRWVEAPGYVGEDRRSHAEPVRRDRRIRRGFDVPR